jgi:transposase
MRKRTSPDAQEHRYSEYFKNLLVRIAEKQIHEHNWTVEDVHRYFSELEHPVAESTLREWRREYKRRSTASTKTVGGGRPPLLDEVEEDVFSGYILHENDKGNSVSQASLATFVRENFEVDCTPHCAGDYARRLGFRFRGLQTGTRRNQYSTDELTDMAFDWIKERRLTTGDPSMVCCLDFTFTSHRKLRAMGYQKKGSKRSKVTTGVTRFTNCIVVCAFADGSDRAPPMMFTYDKRFDFTRNQTDLRSEDTRRINELFEELKAYGIAMEDVVYLEPPINKRGSPYTYVGERELVLQQFMEKRDVPKMSPFSTMRGRFLEVVIRRPLRSWATPNRRCLSLLCTNTSPCVTTAGSALPRRNGTQSSNRTFRTTFRHPSGC